jgi:hypothetical protein
MSTAWYKSRMVPKLVQEWKNHKRSMEVWETTCIVTNFRTANCQFLINPTNPQLTGVSKFPYFPKGGPQPKDLPTKDAHHIMGYVRLTLRYCNACLLSVCVLTHLYLPVCLLLF